MDNHGATTVTTTVQPVISNQLSVIKRDSNCAGGVGVAKAYLAELIADCGRIELRRICQDKQHNRFRWFDEVEPLWAQARQWAGEGTALFTSINEPMPDAKRNRGLRDEAVSRYRRLLFDFDPIREKGNNSTDAQVEAALAMRDDFVQRMHAMGWPEPALAMSGNGAHAVYRVDLEITPERGKAISGFYRGLFGHLRWQGVDFDRCTFNPARLCRLYGAFNRKAPATEERPQRVATVSVPPEYRVVSERALQLAIDTYQIKQISRPARPITAVHVIGKGNYKTLDVVAWMESHGLYGEHLEQNKHAVACPWSDEHTTVGGSGETIVFAAQGDDWPGFFCHHSHCHGRRIQQVMELFGDADAFCRSVFS